MSNMNKIIYSSFHPSIWEDKRTKQTRKWKKYLWNLAQLKNTSGFHEYGTFSSKNILWSGWFSPFLLLLRRLHLSLSRMPTLPANLISLDYLISIIWIVNDCVPYRTRRSPHDRRHLWPISPEWGTFRRHLQGIGKGKMESNALPPIPISTWETCAHLSLYLSREITYRIWDGVSSLARSSLGTLGEIVRLNGKPLSSFKYAKQ